jgi:hypothetical protein
MKKQLLLATFLISTIGFAQEKYYGQIKTFTKVNGKSKTEISTVSLNIDDEYKRVGLSTNEPQRYEIIESIIDDKTGFTKYSLTLIEGTGTLDATVVANKEKAIFKNLKTNEEITFDSRSRPSISVR